MCLSDSAGGKVVTSDRARLDAARAGRLIFMRMNMQLLKHSRDTFSDDEGDDEDSIIVVEG